MPSNPTHTPDPSVLTRTWEEWEHAYDIQPRTWQYFIAEVVVPSVIAAAREGWVKREESIDWVAVHLAQRYERERDEARELAQHNADKWNVSERDGDILRAQLTTLRSQVEEARREAFQSGACWATDRGGVTWEAIAAELRRRYPAPANAPEGTPAQGEALRVSIVYDPTDSAHGDHVVITPAAAAIVQMGGKV